MEGAVTINPCILYRNRGVSTQKWTHYLGLQPSEMSSVREWRCPRSENLDREGCFTCKSRRVFPSPTESLPHLCKWVWGGRSHYRSCRICARLQLLKGPPWAPIDIGRTTWVYLLLPKHSVPFFCTSSETSMWFVDLFCKVLLWFSFYVFLRRLIINLNACETGFLERSVTAVLDKAKLSPDAFNWGSLFYKGERILNCTSTLSTLNICAIFLPGLNLKNHMNSAYGSPK